MTVKIRSLFTLLELLVVVGVIAMLLALLLPVLKGVKDEVKRTACSSNMRQLGCVMECYRMDHGEHYPPVASLGWTPLCGRWYWSLLIQMGVTDENDNGGLSFPGNPYLRRRSTIFWCPSDTRSHTTIANDPFCLGYGLNETGPQSLYNAWSIYVPFPAARLARPASTPCIICGDAWVVSTGGTTWAKLCFDGINLPHRNTVNVLYYDTHVDAESRIVRAIIGTATFGNWLKGKGF